MYPLLDGPAGASKPGRISAGAGRRDVSRSPRISVGARRGDDHHTLVARCLRDGDALKTEDITPGVGVLRSERI